MKPGTDRVRTFPVPLCLLASLAAQGLQSPGWTPAPSLPQPLHSIDAAKDDLGRIYVVGGQTLAETTSAVAYRFDEVSGWTTLSPMLTPRSAYAIAADGLGRIYVFGGGSTAARPTAECYNPGTDAWTPIAGLPLPVANARAVANLNGTSIYLLGGSPSPGTSTNVAQRYDVATGQWSTIAPMLRPRVYFGAAMGRDGYLYAVGGTQWNAGSPTNGTVERLDPCSGQWEFVAALRAHPHHVGTALAGPDGSIFAIGGWNSSGGPLTSAVERYDAATDAWSLCSPYPHAGNTMAAALGVSGRLYVFGGHDGPNRSTAACYRAFPERTGRAMRVSAPALVGTTAQWSMTYPGLAQGRFYVFLWSNPPFSTPIPVNAPGFLWHGHLRTDPFASLTAFSGTLPTGPLTSVSHAVVIPNLAALVGYRWDVQSVDLHQPTLTFAFADNDLTMQVTGAVPPGMVAIAPGTFAMGSNAGQAHEQPVHQVTITRHFWIGRIEVTQAEYSAIMNSNPSRFVHPERPVERLSIGDAQAYCAALNLQEASAGRLPSGYEYRLPTEAEWEYCCRAGTTTEWNTGTTLTNATFGGAGSTSVVGSHPPNAWGLHDMHGNVGEFCVDRWDGVANYRACPVSDPFVARGSFGFTRGGGYATPAVHCRSAHRAQPALTAVADDMGFRVVLAPILQ